MKRVQEELSRIDGALLWVTKPKEIEGYVPGKIISMALELENDVRDVEQFEKIFPGDKKSGDSYLEKVLKRKTFDKVAFAAKSASLIKREDMVSSFDWEVRIKEVVKATERWNQ